MHTIEHLLAQHVGGTQRLSAQRQQAIAIKEKVQRALFGAGVADFHLDISQGAVDAIGCGVQTGMGVVAEQEFADVFSNIVIVLQPLAHLDVSRLDMQPTEPGGGNFVGQDFAPLQWCSTPLIETECTNEPGRFIEQMQSLWRVCSSLHWATKSTMKR